MASEARSSEEDSVVPHTENVQAHAPPSRFVVAKDYKPHGDMTLYRLSSSTPFICSHCNKEKRAKLVATYQDNWEDLRCNACYGEILSED
jgi:hypothetical protein